MTGGKVGPTRVLFAPDYRSGITYQADLAQSLRTRGVETLFLSHYRLGFPLSRGSRDLAPWDGLHLHWPEAYIHGRAAWRKLRFSIDLGFASWSRPLFLTAHNLYPHNRRNEPMMRSALRRTVRRASAIFVHSPQAKGLYADEFGADAAKCHVIPFGDHAAAVGAPIAKAEARAQLDLPPDDPVCIMFGTISPYKGQDEIVAAWKQVPMGYRLVVVGPTVNEPHARELRSMAEGVPNIDLRIGPWLGPSDLRIWLSASDAAIFNYREILTSGAACLARSFGLPIVFPTRLVAVDLGEPDPSVFRYESLTGDFPELLARAVSRGIRYAEAKSWRDATSWERVAELTASVYRDVINP